mmetsp:Transcript_25955/g.55228  ORF Transcript_25955/g.55228 Transcript_25955/m.55228 type:complete len:83 (-) Transcript_25955:201-449(-)
MPVANELAVTILKEVMKDQEVPTKHVFLNFRKIDGSLQFATLWEHDHPLYEFLFDTSQYLSEPSQSYAVSKSSVRKRRSRRR